MPIRLEETLASKVHRIFIKINFVGGAGISLIGIYLLLFSGKVSLEGARLMVVLIVFVLPFILMFLCFFTMYIKTSKISIIGKNGFLVSTPMQIKRLKYAEIKSVYNVIRYTLTGRYLFYVFMKRRKSKIPKIYFVINNPKYRLLNRLKSKGIKIYNSPDLDVIE